ncbi:ATP-dependent RNA helicase DHX8 [Purpureocillium lavendulum]|uniref:ATP-dependent RNA helicase DHX8 n=1 Tax=Purpureocillium lavendulum TaxID=1247861 RepID=A0AB34G2P5_9HYPO|nr:ATP-dependent RNA helicase DHX8 [Purpureocillium lavendulum]
MTEPQPVPYRQIRALYDDDTVTVYQAYKRSIADAAVKHQKLNASPDFRGGRMTWIKPSWAWMMYRAGYSFKDPGQERILALRMKHRDFIKLLERGVLSTHDPAAADTPRDKTAEVRIQWDPERTPKLGVLPYRSIQIGIPGTLSTTWATQWIDSIEDVTDTARRLKETIDQRPDISTEELVDMGLVPEERPLAVSDELATILRMKVPTQAA